MGTFGFSYIGLLFLIMLFIPNIMWTGHKPEGYSSDHENKLLLLFERTGQITVTATVLIFSNFNFHKLSLWSLWLFAAILIMILYECWWICYFRSKQTLHDFYSGFLGIPLAGATLPVAAFFLLSIYGKVPLLTLFTAILGIGHIGIHVQHYKKIKK